MAGYTRYTRYGVTLQWVADANRKRDELLRAGLICAACGRKFSDTLKRSTKKDCCEECKRAID